MSFISGTGLTSGQSSGNVSSIVKDKDQITKKNIKDSLVISSNYTDLKTEANTEATQANLALMNTNSANITTNTEATRANLAIINTNSANITTNTESIEAN